MVQSQASLLPDGAWVTMVTPLTEQGQIDYGVIEDMILWYLGHGLAGLFAVCQSSEMHYLSLDERVRLARFVREHTPTGVPVVASGHIANQLGSQLDELKAMAQTGVDAVIVVSNRLALPSQSDAVWRKSMERVLDTLDPSLRLGLYECPNPYRRLISPDLLSWCASTGRFFFLKETGCDASHAAAKIRAVRGTPMKVFDAFGGTLRPNLAAGGAGYCGVMANFHPDIYAWAIAHADHRTPLVDEVFAFLASACSIEAQLYPVCAKYHLQLEGVRIGLTSRWQESSQFTAGQKQAVRQLRRLARQYQERIATTQGK